MNTINEKKISITITHIATAVYNDYEMVDGSDTVRKENKTVTREELEHILAESAINENIYIQVNP